MPPRHQWRNLREEVRDNHKLLINKSRWSKVKANNGCPWTDLRRSILWSRPLATDGKIALLACMALTSVKSSSLFRPSQIANNQSVRVTPTHSIRWTPSCKSTESNRCCWVGRRWVSSKYVTSTRNHPRFDLRNKCTDQAIISRLTGPNRKKQV